MEKSPNLGLTLTPLSQSSKTFQAFRLEMAGDDETSNLMILDAEIAKLIARLAAYDSGAFTWGMLKDGFGTKAQAEETE